MSKSLFQKGADFTTAMIFMFASTNLVVELGIVLIVLLGWQFAAAEFVGGPIMIALLALTGSFVVGRHMANRARARLQSGQMAGGHDHDAMVGVSDERQAELEREPWSAKLRSRAAWSDAASYAVADITMLRRELVFGYVVAGFLTIEVPQRVWNNVFLHGHGFWTSLENVIVGPFIAIISFVCSIGNVPLAAALWHGGISFGGVIAFIFADLITLPLLLIYRKYYGTRLMLRLLVWFWAVMAIAGLAVELIFDGAGLIPSARPGDIVKTSFHWNYTTFLNLVFIGVAGYLYWLYRNRARFGGSARSFFFFFVPLAGVRAQLRAASVRTARRGCPTDRPTGSGCRRRRSRCRCGSARRPCATCRRASSDPTPRARSGSSRQAAESFRPASLHRRPAHLLVRRAQGEGHRATALRTSALDACPR